MKIGVIGSGKFGIVLANIAAENGSQVLIYSRRPAEVDSINFTKKSLSGHIFSDQLKLQATNSSEDLNVCDVLIIALPSKDFRSCMENLKVDLTSKKLVSCTKGFEERTGMLMTEILAEDFSVKKEQLFVLSGPNLSKEILHKELTGTVVAGDDQDFIEKFCLAIKNDYFIPFSNEDRYGVELGGAMKNIYAIVSGYFHQKGVGENTIGFLLTKSLEEISIYSHARGANPSTFLGLSGVGDFFSTALSKDSRNYQFGQNLALGLSPEDSITKLGDTVEGYLASKVVYEDTLKRGLNLKILNFLMKVYGGKISRSDEENILVTNNIESDIKFNF